MLDKKKYNRQELIELFGTNRMDSIKSKLNRQGYKYTTSGRGDSFALTITELPPRFRNFCIKELGFAPQTDFKKLKKFLYVFFFDEEFQKLPFSEMERWFDKNDEHISYQTMSKYFSKLIENDLIWRSTFDYNYYTINHNREQITIFIDRDVYREAWKAYWEGREYSYFEACSNMYKVSHGTPHKIGKVVENAFGGKKLDELIEILEQEKNIDE